MRRKSLVCLLLLFTLLCAFASSGEHAQMAKHESGVPPQMHVKQVVALPGLGYMFAGTEKVWTFSPTNIWVQGSNLSDSVQEQLPQATQHFDGQKWTRYAIPFDSYGDIVSSSPTSAWATGFETIGGHGYATDIAYLDYFDGTAWKNVFFSRNAENLWL